jgi:transposase
MANHLTMALIDSILTLHQRGWSQRRIARELGIDRETVARYLKPPPPPNPAIAPPGSPDATAPPTPADAPPGSPTAADPTPSPRESPLAAPPPDAAGADQAAPPERRGPGRVSDCQPYRAVIVAWLDQGLSGQRIYQDLVTEHGFTGSYFSVRRFVRRLQRHTPLPFRRMECGPGDEAQVDFGTGAPVLLPSGKRQRTHVFRIVLSYSRKAYSEVVTRQTTDAFLGCLEHAFWSFGGAPQRLVLDNLRAAVQRADWFDPELNPKARSFAAHYGVVFLPARPYVPRHKGKVERGVGYVQDNALKGRCFAGLAEQNAFLRDWEQAVADTRVHGTTRQQVGKVFAALERPTLRPLPAERFPRFREAQRTVHRDGHVEVARAYYSLPPEYLGRRVWVRWDGHLVRLFNDRLEPLAVHVQQEPGRFSTQPGHLAREKVSSTEHGAAGLLAKVRRLGAGAGQWAEGLLQSRGIEGPRVLVGLLSLARRHPPAALDHACGVAHARGCYRLRTVRALLDRAPPAPERLAFLEDHPLIRSLAEYGQVLPVPFPEES